VKHAYDALIRMHIDEFLVGVMSQVEAGDTGWYLHFRGGPRPVLQQVCYEVSIVAAPNIDHCKPQLRPDSLEWNIRWLPPFNPSEFVIVHPETGEPIRCLICTDAAGFVPPATAPAIEAVAQPVSWAWRWEDLPF